MTTAPSRRSPACCAPRRTKSTCKAEANDKELADGFPAKAEELFAYQGLIIGSVELNYFTPVSNSSSMILWIGAAAGCYCWAGALRSPMAAGPAGRWPT